MRQLAAYGLRLGDSRLRADHAPAGDRHGHRALRPRPRAAAKWLAGSVEHDPAEMIAAAFSPTEARDPARRRTWVILVDEVEHQLDLIRAEAARRGHRHREAEAGAGVCSFGQG